eukprot:4128483-Pleurochrysis_carterae.AAC.11
MTCSTEAKLTSTSGTSSASMNSNAAPPAATTMALPLPLGKKNGTTFETVLTTSTTLNSGVTPNGNQRMPLTRAGHTSSRCAWLCSSDYGSGGIRNRFVPGAGLFWDATAALRGSVQGVWRACMPPTLLCKVLMAYIRYSIF